MPEDSQRKPDSSLLVWIKLITVKIKICSSWLVLLRLTESHCPPGAACQLSSLPPSSSLCAFSLFSVAMVLSPSLRCIWSGDELLGVWCLVLVPHTTERGVEVLSFHHYQHCIFSWPLPWVRTRGFSKQREYVLGLMVVHESARKGSLHRHLVSLLRSLWICGFWPGPWPLWLSSAATTFRVLLVFFVYYGT